MKIIPIALDATEQLILDPSFWTHCKMLVSAIAGRDDLPKEDKHKKVSDCLFILMGDIGQTAIDIGIKVAVIWLKTQAAKQAG